MGSKRYFVVAESASLERITEDVARAKARYRSRSRPWKPEGEAHMVCRVEHVELGERRRVRGAKGKPA